MCYFSSTRRDSELINRSQYHRHKSLLFPTSEWEGQEAMHRGEDEDGLEVNAEEMGMSDLPAMMARLQTCLPDGSVHENILRSSSLVLVADESSTDDETLTIAQNKVQLVSTDLNEEPHDPSESLNKFTLFPQLRFELRVAIWRLALRHNNQILLLCTSSPIFSPQPVLRIPRSHQSGSILNGLPRKPNGAASYSANRRSMCGSGPAPGRGYSLTTPYPPPTANLVPYTLRPTLSPYWETIE